MTFSTLICTLWRPRCLHRGCLVWDMRAQICWTSSPSSSPPPSSWPAPPSSWQSPPAWGWSTCSWPPPRRRGAAGRQNPCPGGRPGPLSARIENWRWLKSLWWRWDNGWIKCRAVVIVTNLKWSWCNWRGSRSSLRLRTGRRACDRAGQRAGDRLGEEVVQALLDVLAVRLCSLGLILL